MAYRPNLTCPLFWSFCLFVFWLCCVAYNILVPWPGTEPRPQLWKHWVLTIRGFPVGSVVKNLPSMQEMQRCGRHGFDPFRSLGWEEPLDEEMATHSSVLAWRIPWIDKLRGLQSMGYQESNASHQLNHHHHLTIGPPGDSCFYKQSFIVTQPHIYLHTA